MIGLQTIINLNTAEKPTNHSSIKEEWHYIQPICKTENVHLEYVGYKGYPINVQEYGDWLVVVEGMIYNQSDVELKDVLQHITNQTDNDAFLTGIKSFVKQCDGDYVVLMLNKNTQKVVVFNNYLGTVPIYYYTDKQKVIIARNMSYVLENRTEVTLHREAMAEYIAMEYHLGNRTLFKDIYKLKPAQVIICEKQHSELKSEVLTLVESDFSMKNEFKNREESLIYLKDIFIKGLKDRIETVEHQNKKIYNQLSGGCDSRAVFAGLDALDNEFTSITYQYIHDESPIAKELLKITDRTNHYIKNAFDLDTSVSDSNKIFKTNALANSFTTAVCYNEEKYNRTEVLNKNAVIFGGIGGEYIRHPFFKPMGSVLDILLYRQPQLRYNNLTSIIKGKEKDINLKQFLSNSLKQYGNVDKLTLTKLLYNEYYINFVNMASVDRSRMSFWHIYPFMNYEFIQAVRNRVPLKWIGFRYFADFIGLMNKELLNVPLYKSNIKLNSTKSLKKMDFLMRTEYKMINLMSIFNTKKHYVSQEKDTSTLNLIKETYNKIQNKDLFNITKIESDFHLYNEPIKVRILTLVQYVYELEQKEYINYCQK